MVSFSFLLAVTAVCSVSEMADFLPSTMGMGMKMGRVQGGEVAWEPVQPVSPDAQS